MPTRLEASSHTAVLLRLAQRGDELFRLPEFVSWMFEPLERIQPYIDRYWSNRSLFGAAVPGQHSRGRKSEAKKQKARMDLEIVISEAINELIDNKWRALYEVRLLRQGTLFQFADRTEDAEIVRGVAAALHPDSSLPAEDQPFLRAMMRLSIEQGPFRAIAEALESARMGTMPISLFPGAE